CTMQSGGGRKPHTPTISLSSRARSGSGCIGIMTLKSCVSASMRCAASSPRAAMCCGLSRIPRASTPMASVVSVSGIRPTSTPMPSYRCVSERRSASLRNASVAHADALAALEALALGLQRGGHHDLGLLELLDRLVAGGGHRRAQGAEQVEGAV